MPEHDARGGHDDGLLDSYLKEADDDPATWGEFEQPADFMLEDTLDEFEEEIPAGSRDYSYWHPVDHADASKVPREARHPGYKIIGRKIRKSFSVQRAQGDRARTTIKTVKGVVTSFNDKTATFRVKYDNGIDERLDLTNLKPLLIMDKAHGDPVEHHGQTRAEIEAAEIEHTVCAAIWDEYLYNRIPTDYGEGEHAHEKRTSLSASSKSDKKSSPKVSFNEKLVQIRTCHADQERVAAFRHDYKLQKEAGKNESREQARNQEKAAGAYKEEAFFAPMPIIKEGEVEDEQVPRDDEPRNKKEADRHRCIACRNRKTSSEPCERCIAEREGIYECWKKEMDQLKKMGVYRELSDQELQEIKRQGKKILNAKMVTKRKYEAVVGKDGIVRDRFLKWKGRLAGVGTSEVKGVDMPWSTFSPVIGLVAVRTVMSLMCREDFHVNAYDLSGAFLAADLDRKVYMKMPAECGEDAGKVVQLTKAIYGLKTSSRDYVEAFSKKILEFEHEGCKFERLYMDACIFRLVGKKGEEIILCHYVDDLIVGSNSIELREKLLTHIREKWNVTDEGPMTRFVGLNFARSANGKSWSMSCAPYIERVAARHGIDDGKYHDTPMDDGFVITPEDLKTEPTEEMLSEYRSLIGSIGFAATTVRYDIAYAVSILSRHLMRPNQKVIDAAKRVIRYLMKTRDFKITWSTEESEIAPDRVNRMWGAVDASFAADPITRRSHSGFLIFNNGGCISWKSGLQKMVTLSSCESEFVGLCSAVVEIRYLRQLMEELGKPQPPGTILWEDNKACIILAEGETSSGGRSKHIDVKLRHTAESVKQGIVSIRYIATAWNYADIMTKPLGRIRFARILNLCKAPEANGVPDSGETPDRETEMANLIVDL